jgi:hypothetical protein
VRERVKRPEQSKPLKSRGFFVGTYRNPDTWIALGEAPRLPENRHRGVNPRVNPRCIFGDNDAIAKE